MKIVGIFLTIQLHVVVTYGFTSNLAFHQIGVGEKRTSSSSIRSMDMEKENVGTFDPFELSEEDANVIRRSIPFSLEKGKAKNTLSWMGPATMPIATMIALPTMADAVTTQIYSPDFNPDNFKPVCSTSDTFYRVLQGTTRSVVGDENFVEYGPLIAGGLLRIRLELCVVESFFNEAVGPFIQKNGLNWILPLHETVETFLAGTIFAAASTFILVGSTKIVSVLFTYIDVFVGGPCRLFGGFFFDRAQGKPVTLEIGIGPWRKQVFGPPIDKEQLAKDAIEGKIIDMDKVTPAGIPVLVTSGAVKATGEVSKVIFIS